MLASKRFLVFLLGSWYISATAIGAASPLNSTDQCISPNQNDCSSSISTLSPTLLETSPQQPTPVPAADDTFEPQTLLHTPETTFARLPPTQSPALTTSSTVTPPSSTPAATDDVNEPQTVMSPLNPTSAPLPSNQSSRPNPTPTFTPPFTPPPEQTPFLNPPIPQQHFSLTIFDETQCHLQKYCLLCLDPTTTLTCYKHNCQCQRGTPAAHYMPASPQSCHKSALCLSCPRGSSPFSWGTMAVCLTVWKHGPVVNGGKNPLTNWTEGGVNGLPVGRVDMSRGGRVRRKGVGLVGMVALGAVTALLLELI